jgi:hypothetical protein
MVRTLSDDAPGSVGLSRRTRRRSADTTSACAAPSAWRRAPAYFYTATRHCALRLLRSAWHRSVVAMDPEDLGLAEQAMVAGKTSDHMVRLPESVEASVREEESGRLLKVTLDTRTHV